MAFPDWPRFSRYEPATALYVSESTSTPFIGGPKTIRYAELQPLIEARFARCRELLELAIKELEDEAAYLTSLAAGEATENPIAAQASETKTKVFIVHGHDHKARGDVALFLARIELQHIILDNEASQGLTIIEQFERHANQAAFAVVLLTPDDIGGAVATQETGARAKQNVIFEPGYFVGKIGRGRVCLLRKGAVEIPSDLHGVIYKHMDDGGGWKHELMKELIAAKLPLNSHAI